jgi:hypothetical protein
VFEDAEATNATDMVFDSYQRIKLPTQKTIYLGGSALVTASRFAHIAPVRILSQHMGRFR